jgi:hypothetical protein
MQYWNRNNENLTLVLFILVTIAVSFECPVVVALNATSGVTSRCKNDLDCQLNGICRTNDGTCLCDPAWSGPDCGFLNLLPAPKRVSFHGPNPNATSWGGSVLSVPTSQLSNHVLQSKPTDNVLARSNTARNATTYIMYVAEMLKNCGLREWRTNSAVVVATASDPAGPYTRQHQIIPPWAHNPEAIALTTQNSATGRNETMWAVYTLGDGDGTPIHGPIKDCTATPSSGASTIPEEHRSHQSSRLDPQHPLLSITDSRRLLSNNDSPISESNSFQDDGATVNKMVNFTIHYSVDSPLGPFSKHTATIIDFPVEFAFPANWNPAPVAMSDGKVRMMVHTNNDQHTQFGIIVEAPTWKGPYRPITMDVTHCHLCQEDPFLWIDHRGHWHALYHKMFDAIDDNGEATTAAAADPSQADAEYYGYLYDNYDGHPDKNGCCPSPGWSGGHAFSVDGLSWSKITRCYNTTTHFEDGTSMEMVRRERPKLIFDPQDGVTPTHLVNGVFNVELGTYTLVTPINNRR